MEEDLALIIDIACRYLKIVESHDLQPAYTPDELASRLIRVHTVDPMDLRALMNLDEVDLVVKVSEAIRGLDAVPLIRSAIRFIKTV